MKDYLKMADVFVGEYKPKRRIDAWPPSRYGETIIELSGSPAQYAVHAINSHDELVAMNKELMAALEVIAASEEFHGGSFVCDFETLQGVAREAIAKAKGI